VREQARQFRETPPAAARASWAANWGKGLVLSLAVSVFLSFVGAFDTMQFPFLERTAFFSLIGIGCGLIVGLVIIVTERIPALTARPLLRRVVICLAITPLIAVLDWGVVGFVYTGGPKLALLAPNLFYAFLMSVAMSVLSWAVFRPRGPTATGAGSATPRFLDRLPVRLRGAEIYAVAAEDHYLRLYTSKGSDLILMRLSDAIAELEGIEGAQTHRSWWVAKAALADARAGDGRATLRLKDGTEAPVSRSYSAALRRSGWY
jgi:hypothetical protein